MGNFAVFDLTESGEKIGRKLFALLTKTQQKELERFISESKNSESDSVLSPCYPAFYGQYSIPRQSDQPMTEIQEGDLYFCLEQRLVTVRGKVIPLTVKEFDILVRNLTFLLCLYRIQNGCSPMKCCWIWYGMRTTPIIPERQSTTM